MENRKKPHAEILKEVQLANGNFISLERVKPSKSNTFTRVVVTDAGGNALRCWEGLDVDVVNFLKVVFTSANDDKKDDELILALVNKTQGCTLRTLETLYFGTKGCRLDTPAELYLAVDKLVESGKLIRMEWHVPGNKLEVFSLLLPQNSKMQVADWDIFFDD
jgi:hypothetical protein